MDFLTLLQMSVIRHCKHCSYFTAAQQKCQSTQIIQFSFNQLETFDLCYQTILQVQHYSERKCTSGAKIIDIHEILKIC